jgi:uncharacterized membrane protein YvbJ
MYCSKCGKELPENVKFCNECGNAVGSSVEESNLSGISDNKKNDKTPARSSGNAFSLVLGLIIGIAVTSVVALLLVLLRSVGAESKSLPELIILQTHHQYRVKALILRKMQLELMLNT